MNVVHLKGTREAPKAMRSQMDTLIFSQTELDRWLIPPFQRQLRINDKVLSLAEELKANGGVIPGVLTLGKVANNPTIYIVDGQHRTHAFRLSDLKEGIADVRICTFDTMADMAEEFVGLQSSLVKMNPDDVLRGLEESLHCLKTIRDRCPFVGYSNIRRGDKSPVLGMSSVLRCWVNSAQETPVSSTAGKSAAQLARELDGQELGRLVAFLDAAYKAWGRDPEYHRLWANFNLCLIMWLWRRLVLDHDRTGNKRHVSLSPDVFRKCMIALTTGDYIDWLRNRLMNERDRTPGYTRVKAIFAQRLMEEDGTTKRPLLPQPAWSVSK